MTLPRVVKLLLMFAPSLSRCPVAPVEFARSEPARSIKLIRDTFSVSKLVSLSCLFIVRSKVKTEWDRDELKITSAEGKHAMNVSEDQRFVHVRRRDRARLVAFVHQRIHLLIVSHDKLRQIFHIRSETVEILVRAETEG